MGVAGNAFSADFTKLSSASANFSIAGFEIHGFTKLTFEEEVEAPPQYGNGPCSEGTAAGKHSAKGSFSVFSATAALLRQVLGGGWATSYFTIVNTLYEPNGAGIVPITLTRVRIGGNGYDMGSPGGSEGSVETMPITIHDPIDWDGIPAIFRPDAGGLSLPVALPGLSLNF